MEDRQALKHIGDILKSLEGLSFKDATEVLKAVQEQLGRLCKLQV